MKVLIPNFAQLFTKFIYCQNFQNLLQKMNIMQNYYNKNNSVNKKFIKLLMIVQQDYVNFMNNKFIMEIFN